MITVAFIGYLVVGFPNACVAALTELPAPYFKRWGKHPSVKAFVDGVTVAAVGAIAGAVVELARRQLINIPAVLIAITTVELLYRLKKLPELSFIGIVAVIGLLLRYVG
ncbi:Chromate transporter [Spirosoma endophyticum]|uniref:Chromate transporter n=1 Tax=Spirosoma endophyticum TaxID=662367 RepID=A0A1I1FZP9_9BACT|nr:Chromate transporter [Spirosoma endophyticum]